jgi:hypothetical protein
MISSFSMMELSELSIDVGELEEMMMDDGNDVDEFESISRGRGRLESDGAIMFEGVDDVIMALE